MMSILSVVAEGLKISVSDAGHFVLGYDIQYSAVPGVILSFFGIVSIIYFNKYYPKKQNQKSN